MYIHMGFLVRRVRSCQIWQPERGRAARALCPQVQAAVGLSSCSWHSLGGSGHSHHRQKHSASTQTQHQWPPSVPLCSWAGWKPVSRKYARTFSVDPLETGARVHVALGSVILSPHTHGSMQGGLSIDSCSSCSSPGPPVNNSQPLWFCSFCLVAAFIPASQSFYSTCQPVQLDCQQWSQMSLHTVHAVPCSIGWQDTSMDTLSCAPTLAPVTSMHNMHTDHWKRLRSETMEQE